MGYVARGLYRELLDEAWMEGSLPNDMDALAEICGCPVETMTEEWKRIVPCWELNTHGRWTNDKLEAQRTEQDASRVAKVRAGRMGGLVKTINKLESAGASQEDIERARKAEFEARDSLAAARQQLADAMYPEADASACHIEEKRREEKRRGKKSISTANAVSPRNAPGKPDPIEEIYKAYPRKVGKAAAIRAISRALQQVKKGGIPLREAEIYLFRRVQSYARSPAGNDGEFTPHPATWFNQGRYDDDPQEWQKKTNEKGSNGNQGRNGFSGAEMSELLDSFGGSTADNAH